MQSVDRFLRQVREEIAFKDPILEELATREEKLTLYMAESLFALMIVAERDRQNAHQAREDAQWDYWATLHRYGKGRLSEADVSSFIDVFTSRVISISQRQNRLDLPYVAQNPNPDRPIVN